MHEPTLNREGTVTEPFERARLDAYFSKVAAQFAPTEQATAFLVAHLLAERPGFVRAAAAMTRLRTVLPKPKSIHPTAQREVEQNTPCDTLSRELFIDPDTALDYLESRAAGESVVLLDVGRDPGRDQDAHPRRPGLGLHEVSAHDRGAIAATWLSYFNR